MYVNLSTLALAISRNYALESDEDHVETRDDDIDTNEEAIKKSMNNACKDTTNVCTNMRHIFNVTVREMAFSVQRSLLVLHGNFVANKTIPLEEKLHSIYSKKPIKCSLIYCM